MSNEKALRPLTLAVQGITSLRPLTLSVTDDELVREVYEFTTDGVLATVSVNPANEILVGIVGASTQSDFNRFDLSSNLTNVMQSSAVIKVAFNDSGTEAGVLTAVFNY